MIYVDAIHAQVEEKKKIDNTRIIVTPMVDDCLCMLIGDKLFLLLLHKNDHMQDMKHEGGGGGHYGQ
jgi:hypothetical protein